MFEVTPIPAFRDNYIWMLHQNGHAVVVDPGDAAPVLSALNKSRLQLDAILITHHHDDHTGGVSALLEAQDATVYAPARGCYAFAHHPVEEGDTISLPEIAARMSVMETPGHTLDHVVYFDAGRLFCGDTLFSCGCGRLFEGSHSQLYHSLLKLAGLPAQTAVYCTHEYTLHNIAFALMAEPQNPALQQRSRQVTQWREAGRPSLPSTIAIELETNPFLRCGKPSIREFAIKNGMPETAPDVEVFRALRELRNSF